MRATKSRLALPALLLLTGTLSASADSVTLGPDACAQPGVRCTVDENGPVALERYDGERLINRREFRNGAFRAGFDIEYFQDPASGRFFPWGFRAYNDDGELIRARSNRDPQPCGEKNNPDAVKVLVLDMLGIDFLHPEFRGRLRINEGELENGRDNDGDGLVDNCVGFSVDAWSTNRHILTPVALTNGELDVSHGTMVASIAMRGLPNTALIPVTGDIRYARFYKPLSETIAREKARFVNISLAFEVSSGSMNRDNGPESLFVVARDEMKRVIREAPDTLFVIAAGNGPFYLPISIGVNIDRQPLYPAAFDAENILSVGAVDTDEIVTGELPTYRLTGFSNYGLKGVDVLAPGQGLEGATAGGGHAKGNGTSFATPYVTNLVLRVARKLPNLSALRIKELVLKTAYVPDVDLASTYTLKSRPNLKELTTNPRLVPTRSGGIVFPERLFAAVRLLRADESLSVHEAALRSRGEVRAPGEPEMTDEFRAKLEALWQAREI